MLEYFKKNWANGREDRNAWFGVIKFNLIANTIILLLFLIYVFLFA